jgi:hypothetical protein
MFCAEYRRARQSEPGYSIRFQHQLRCRLRRRAVDSGPRPVAPATHGRGRQNTPKTWRSDPTDQPVKPTGQVAVFVGRKEKKIFVRQGFVPLFELPVAIDDPDQPLGTRVFTAMEVTGDGTGMHWNLITVPTDPSILVEHRDSRRRSKEAPKPVVHGKPSSTAAQALDRIHLPQQAVERIGELLVPGSSLVVSDEGLAWETGRGTEFIVLTW